MSGRRFDRFVAELSSVELSDRAHNQYANAIRRRNLRLYLREMDAIGPRILLVGEAPSHRGGRLTGIPFVSETILLRGVDLPHRRILGADRGYRKATPGARLSTEASATMVWATIACIDPLPLLWNAFPFHPFASGNPSSNRIPSAGELRVGARFVEWLIRLFPIERVVAVGNQAGMSLAQLGIDHEKVRHPSQGGKVKFIAGMARLWQQQTA